MAVPNGPEPGDEEYEEEEEDEEDEAEEEEEGVSRSHASFGYSRLQVEARIMPASNAVYSDGGSDGDEDEFEIYGDD